VPQSELSAHRGGVSRRDRGAPRSTRRPASIERDVLELARRASRQRRDGEERERHNVQQQDGGRQPGAGDHRAERTLRPVRSQLTGASPKGDRYARRRPRRSGRLAADGNPDRRTVESGSAPQTRRSGCGDSSGGPGKARARACPGPPEEASAAIPPEFQEKLVHEALDKHYRASLDEPTPMLGNVSPRAAARTAKGREDLVVWLKHLENQSQ